MISVETELTKVRYWKGVVSVLSKTLGEMELALMDRQGGNPFGLKVSNKDSPRDIPDWPNVTAIFENFPKS